MNLILRFGYPDLHFVGCHATIVGVGCILAIDHHQTSGRHHSETSLPALCIEHIGHLRVGGMRTGGVLKNFL